MLARHPLAVLLSARSARPLLDRADVDSFSLARAAVVVPGGAPSTHTCRKGAYRHENSWPALCNPLNTHRFFSPAVFVGLALTWRAPFTPPIDRRETLCGEIAKPDEQCVRLVRRSPTSGALADRWKDDP